MRSFHRANFIPSNGWVWVFGSDEGGRHTKGHARVARVNFRAQYGIWEGPTGEAYAIPVRDHKQTVLPLLQIAYSVQAFLDHARQCSARSFFVTRLATGPKEYADDEMARLFANAPANCSLPEEWRGWVPTSSF